MKRILIVKITSLGDMVFAQPLVADLRRSYPGVKIDWVADAYCADIVSWNPDVDRIIAPPLRQFKQTRSWADLKRILAAIVQLRQEQYDVVLDMHGMYKSAIVSFLARSKLRFGYSDDFLGETGAAFAYTHRFPSLHGYSVRYGHRFAVSEALGYPLEGEPQYGFQVDPPDHKIARGAPLAMLFHAASIEEKKWPLERWIAVGRRLAQHGYRVALPWGSPQERQDAEAISHAVPGAEVLPRMTVRECAQFVGASSLVIGLDTGFVHLVDALGKPTLMLFSATSRELYGIDAPGRAASLGWDGKPPTVAAVLEALETLVAPAAPTAPVAASLEPA